MDHARWQSLEQLFDAAIRLPPAERTAWIRQACGSDLRLLDELESLLACDCGAGSFLRGGIGAAALEFSRRRIPEFRGNGRFILQGLLGEGGFGIVHKAWDEIEQTTVALKTLRHSHIGLCEFKREFRSLAGLSHPHLVQLFELFTDADVHWFFTMELVHGSDFVEFARVHSLDEQLIMDTVRQLADGIAFLHASGKLHRDLKPSNVLVTSGGHVVILDFGLVAETDPVSPASEPAVAGTPAFMAPEQRNGSRLTPACDWYSFGAILSRVVAAAPSTTDVLGGVSIDLMHPDPSSRPEAREIFRRLGSRHSCSSVLRPRPSFIGRRAELDVLSKAVEHASGGSVVVIVEGPPGVGKTALVKHFLEGLMPDGTVLVLTRANTFLY